MALPRPVRLYRAARTAGAGAGAAADALVVSAVVLTRTAARSPRRPGRQNALRHFAWQALLTARHGSAVAEALAAAQEHGSARPEDTAVDLHNNEVGRRYGEQHAAELRDLGVPAAVGRLCDVADPLWRSGELHVVDPRR